ncbi:hypothetical protein EV127DRAFT_89293 [Xylaria flabelliformis]|nr:hypothetical protein EV127DRAFT_89293 [Xylaria flabelliformis]KAI0855970.1 hypothetical protein F4860DRAFT_428296 [Xylaria cubensis]
MPVLQRSCRSCASAKRQCDLAVPRCGRCSSRGKITCKYINQPGPARPNPQTFNHTSDSEVEAVDTALTLPKSVVEPGLQIYNTLRLEVVRTFDPTTVEGQINILQSFPLKYAWCGSNAFIHPYAYGSQSPAPLSDVSSILGAICGMEAEYPYIPVAQMIKFKIRHLLHLGARASSYTELVSCVQAIVLLHIFRLSHRDLEDDLDHENWAIWVLTHQMWERAPTQLSSSLSPWRAWLFAESVRRTLLVCNILLGVYGVLKRGYAVRHLCIETLPFDLRTQLWDADSEESWRAAASYNGSANPLVSFRQFKSVRKSCLSDSPFENLLCLSFKDLN